MAPAMRSLGYTNELMPMQPPHGYTNLFNPPSLPSQLRDSAFDSLHGTLMINDLCIII